MREKAPMRRRAAKAPSKSIRERLAEPFANIGSAVKIANIIVMLFTLYIIASLYTPWTGDGGAGIAASLLASVGGSVVVPLLFVLYLSSVSYTHLYRAAAPLVKEILGNWDEWRRGVPKI